MSERIYECIHGSFSAEDTCDTCMGRVVHDIRPAPTGGEQLGKPCEIESMREVCALVPDAIAELRDLGACEGDCHSDACLGALTRLSEALDKLRRVREGK